jgi:biotin transport system substrate-specific component
VRAVATTLDPSRALSFAAAAGGMAFFALCTAAGAQLAVRLPISPVPITAQTLFVLLSGALLGRKLGAGSQLLYGAVALCCPGALAGPIHFTAGYVLGFVAAAYLVGLLVGESRSFGRAAGAMAVGSAVVYLLGAAWLAGATGDPVGAVIRGVLPFLPGDALKVVAAAAIVAGGRAAGARRRREPAPET